MVKSSTASDKSSLADYQVKDAKSAFGARVRAAAEKKGWNQKRLAEESEVAPARINEYWRGLKEATSQNLFSIAAALDAPAEWLALGTQSGRAVELAVASDVDVTDVEEYDLRQIAETGKGEPLSRTPMRRDWLQRSFGEWRDLWITALPADYRPLGLVQGHPVFAIDADAANMVEGGLYIWRINQGFVVSRFSHHRDGEQLAVGDRIGDYYVSPKRIGFDETEFNPIARILGQPVSKLA